MKKLLKMFKALPPELRMLIAMAGLGSPMGAVYALRRWVFPNTSVTVLILCVAAVVGVLALLGFLIMWVFRRGSKKRASQMAGALSSDETAGPVSMDERAAIKENKDKFFTAVREMKARDIDVYDLPWYMVIGDSGCGKTKLINEGGLIFSLGRPEGYRLGTLNYNWWFTEDAIFIDMAGRLINPKDDADHREWHSFLDTIRKGRKGFPINGVITCVAVDDLLTQSIDSVQANANTLLERLRDIQSKLGVTFATYLVITKCDKVVGFLEFFKQAEVDFGVRNQMFGWSRSGDFGELYNPDEFQNDFSDLYGRLNELRLKRLNDDEADDVKQGLAYGFPEEFRQLTQPLEIYVRTLFPMVKNPRAIKNLIFRGIYFTSATQEGELVLNHLTERLGADAAGQFSSLDLYPEKIPYFIHDLLFNKIFPEKGMVYRNEQEAARNKKLAKMINIGSLVLFLVMGSLLGYSSWKFDEIIGSPTDAAKDAREQIPSLAAATAVDLVDRLDGGVRMMEENPFPRKILSLGFGADEPIELATRVQLGVFERGMLRPALQDIEAAFNSGAALNGDAESGKAYLSALKEYIAWNACAPVDTMPLPVTADSFKALCSVVGDSKSIVASAEFERSASEYFNTINQSVYGERRNPARLLAQEGLSPDETIRKALTHLREIYFARFAKLDGQHPNPTVAEWMRIQGECKTVQTSYDDILSSAEPLPATSEDFVAFVTNYREEYRLFDSALKNCAWRIGPASGPNEIPNLVDAILATRAEWLTFESAALEALRQCSAREDQERIRAITSLRAGDRGLDRELWANLHEAGLVDAHYTPENYENLAERLREVQVAYGHIIRLDVGQGFNRRDEVNITDDARAVLADLTEIRKNFDDPNAGADYNRMAPAMYLAELEKLISERGEGRKDQAAIGSAAERELAVPWAPDDLRRFYVAHTDVVRKARVTRVFEALEGRLASTGDWGVAELAPGWCDMQPSSFTFDLIPNCNDPDRRAQPGMRERSDTENTADSAGTSTPDPLRDLGGRRPSAEPQASPPPPDRRRDANAQAAPGGTAPTCCLRDFIHGRLDECGYLRDRLAQFAPEHSFFLPDRKARLLNELEDAGNAYVFNFHKAWENAYLAMKMPRLEKLRETMGDWESLTGALEIQGRGRDVVGEIEEETRASLSEVISAMSCWGLKRDAKGWYPGLVSGSGFDNEVQWMTSACGRLSDSTRAICEAELHDSLERADPPWNFIPGEVAASWRKLAIAIEKSKYLPEFKPGQGGRYKEFEPIPWGELRKLRQTLNFVDESISGQLLDFEQEAQRLLNRSISEKLVKLQENQFPSTFAPKEGWPYIQNPNDALHCVDFNAFVIFLEEVEELQKALTPLESSMNWEWTDSDDRDVQAFQDRLHFYRQCEAWAKFIGVGSSPRKTIGVDLWGEDPLKDEPGKNPPDSWGQYGWDAATLNIGLKLKDKGRPGGDVIRIAIAMGKEDIQKVVWDWSNLDLKNVMVEITDGKPIDGVTEKVESISDKLGDWSQLALPAYLQHYGVRKDRTWYVSHSHDIHAIKNRNVQSHIKGQRNIKTIGYKFAIELSEPLPDPITPLRIP